MENNTVEDLFRKLESIEKENISEKRHIYNDIGIYYANHKDYSQAIVYFQKSLDIHEELRDVKNTAILYLNIGGLYQITKNFKKSREYFEKALKLGEECGDSFIIKRAEKELKKTDKSNFYYDDIDSRIHTAVMMGDHENARRLMELRKNPAIMKGPVGCSMMIIGIIIFTINYLFNPPPPEGFKLEFTGVLVVYLIGWLISIIGLFLVLKSRRYHL